jgi:tetratricopeptide (TPR) repeat protein
MKAIIKSYLLFLVLLGAVLMSNPAQAISPYDDVLVQKAAQDLQQENYDEALAGLTEAWQKGTHTPEKAFLLAQTYRQMLNYPKAKEYLEEALRLKPNLSQAQLMLADTLLALDRPKDALPILQSLEASGFEPGQVAFLRGMIETKEGRYSQALDYFQKAQQDPRMAQEAKFQASLALAALNRLKEARKSMEEAISINTRSQTADFANRYMGILDKRLDEIKPFRATVTAGFEYDSNVTLQPGGAGAATQVSGQGDAVFTQTATFEYNLHAQGPFSLLTQYSYFQNFHPHLGNFDIISHYVGAIPTYSYKSGRVWLPFSYNYVDVASDKYFTGFLFTPTWLHMLNDNFGVETTPRFARRYYWTPLSFGQDDRSGKDYGGSLGAYYFIKNQKGFLQARISYDHDATTGSNWVSDSYRLFLNVLYPITDNLKANAFVDLALQPYEHQFFNGLNFEAKRFDKILITGFQLTYQLPKGFDINVHYFFTRDNSNTSLYNYSRNIVGCQLGYRY